MSLHSTQSRGAFWSFQTHTIFSFFKFLLGEGGAGVCERSCTGKKYTCRVRALSGTHPSRESLQSEHAGGQTGDHLPWKFSRVVGYALYIQGPNRGSKRQQQAVGVSVETACLEQRR